MGAEIANQSQNEFDESIEMNSSLAELVGKKSAEPAAKPQSEHECRDDDRHTVNIHAQADEQIALPGNLINEGGRPGHEKGQQQHSVNDIAFGEDFIQMTSK